MKQPTPYYPVCLNLAGRRCIVIGGGQVALRKVGTLVEHGAAVEVISPEPCPGLIELAAQGKIRLTHARYHRGALGSALLVVAATDDRAANRSVADDARASGVLINSVDDPDASDFIVPASFSRGDLTIAISTAGRSPALARRMRAKLEAEIGEPYAALAELAGEVRAELKARGVTVSAEQWQDALDLERLISLLRDGCREEAKALLTSALRRGAAS
jgi:precorrin-2 dehydrogenase/sirohydrochlorin ferrochelatase